jgi:DNA polymerase-4
MSFLCRACGTAGTDTQTQCCLAPWRLAHPELETLTLAHVDCDAFFAAIEKRDDPSLAAKPVIVGGGKRGVVATACYLARAYGVRSAMPMFKALALCPAAVVKKPDLARYSAEGRIIRDMMQALTPLVQAVSIDEAYLDLAGCEALHGAPAAAVLSRLQNRIEQERGLTVSVGLSHNKLMAKMASEADKPHGFAIIGRQETQSFLAVRPISALPGIGPAGAKALARAGYGTIASLQEASSSELVKALGEWGLRLSAMARGIDNRPIDPEGERKSLSAETTFNEDLADPAALEDRLWLLCERVSARARAAETAGRVVTLKLKDTRFRTRTRQRGLSEPTLLARRLFEEGRAMLAAEADGRIAFRLIGIGLSDFARADEADRGDLMDQTTPKRAAAEAAVARLRDRFGSEALDTGRALKLRRRAKPAAGE